MATVTHQTISRLFQTYLTTLTLLSFADCRMMVHFSKPLDLSTGWGRPMHNRYVDVVRALMGTSTKTPDLTVGEILDKFAPGEPTGRLAMLTAISNRLIDRLTVVQGGRSQRCRPSASGWLQKTFVSLLDNEQLYRVVSARQRIKGTEVQAGR